jgi:outer membrane protein assembly factor BamB
MNVRPFLPLLALLLLLSPAPAEDWPQFRGPRRDGSWNERGLQAAFPPGGLRIRWRQPVGPGWASPVVVAGRAYLADAEYTAPTVRERLLCFDAETGKPLWTFAYEVKYPEWAFVPGQSNGPTATPVVAGGKVYMVGVTGDVHCLEALTGTVLWKDDLKARYEVREMACRPSPLIYRHLLILFTGAKPGAAVLALHKDTGKEVWKALDDPVSNSSPIIAEAGGRRQLIVWTDESITSLDPATGARYWREAMTTSGNDSIPTPVVQGQRLLVSGLMLELDRSSPAATILWPENRAPAKRLLSNTSTPVLQGDYIYSALSGGELVCLDAATGRQLWSESSVTDRKTGASIHITPCGENAFLFTNQGNLILARLTSEEYREISRFHLIDPTTPFSGRKCAWTAPAYADRHVYARTDEEVVCASLAAE